MLRDAAHLLGMTRSLSPTVTSPDSLLPMTMVPISLYLSITGMRKGAIASRWNGSVESSTCRVQDQGSRLILLMGLC